MKEQKKRDQPVSQKEKAKNERTAKTEPVHAQVSEYASRQNIAERDLYEAEYEYELVLYLLPVDPSVAPKLLADSAAKLGRTGIAVVAWYKQKHEHVSTNQKRQRGDHARK